VLQTAVQQSTGAVDDLERALDTVGRVKKIGKRLREVFDEGESSEEEKKASKKQGVGASPEGEDSQPRVRFQGTGQRWKDGREVMMPIDSDGEPIFPTTLPAAMATGFANPFLLEPIAQGVGAVMQRVAAMATGLGQPQAQRSDIQVQQVQPQQQQQAPAPVPYYPPPQQMPMSPQQQSAPAPSPSPAGGDYDLS
jgi:hypothetical protein